MTDDRSYSWCVQFGMGSSVSASEATLEDALAHAFEQATYYLPRYSAQSGLRVTIEEYCRTCCMEGKVKGKGSRMKRCPSCKGVGTYRKIGPFPVAVNHHVEVIDREGAQA